MLVTETQKKHFRHITRVIKTNKVVFQGGTREKHLHREWLLQKVGIWVE